MDYAHGLPLAGLAELDSQLAQRLYPLAALVAARVWAQDLAWLAENHGREEYAVDATYERVHAHGTRARGGYSAQAVDQSPGGLTSKVHLLTDALGYILCVLSSMAASVTM